jgi:hypothetical protein
MERSATSQENLKFPGMWAALHVVGGMRPESGPEIRL